MRSFRHWTPRYIRDRLAVMLYEYRNPESPWLTRSMVQILDAWLKPTDIGFEFGSGRSTVWFSKRVNHITSVEHNPEWYHRVKEKIRLLNLGNRVDYRLIEDAKGVESQYVHVAHAIKPSTLDFCLVDGLARDYCVLSCIDKIKPGGILIVDNISWYWPRHNKSCSPNSRSLTDGYASKVWEECAEAIENWRCIWTSNGVTDTAFWVRPPNS